MDTALLPKEVNYNGFIVAVGASAGGLEALEQFFSACPTDTGLPFVVIQHLSPDHKSMMADLLSRYTSMPIKLVAEGMTIRPNHVYLIPAGTIMRVVGGHFVLTKKQPHVLSLPIDIFFTSLAAEYAAKSIGVILSGTGSDGTRGAFVVNEAGGFLLAQSPQEAKFNGMPNSVVATGLVDAVLPAKALIKRVLHYVDNPQRPPKSSADPLQSEAAQNPLNRIFHYLAKTTGVDFNEYKPATVQRRIQRRMQVKHIASLDEYAQLLARDQNELGNLRRELFIPVTSFFRDSDAFADLQKLAIQNIVENTESNGAIRVWSAGVSSGEEIYSIAMLFFEAFEKARTWPNLKIFATDVNPLAIELASAGHYPESIAAEVSTERLERFFIQSGSEYIVRPELRQVVVFAQHNLIADPPFTRMNLVTCRNTLIYFNNQAQKKALQRLQYATQPGGFLFLGTSESINDIARGFDTVDSKSKLFKRNKLSMPLMGLEANNNKMAAYKSTRSSQVAHRNESELAELSLLDQTSHDLIEAYSPPGFLVNQQHEVIHLYNDVKPFYRLKPGAVSMDITRILPDEFISVVSALLFKALKDQAVFYSDHIQTQLADHSWQDVRVCVRPIVSAEQKNYALVLFETVTPPRIHSSKPAINVNDENSARIKTLKQELTASRESLQATIEELETSNEELQATNEELMASNEELQSSNEELQSVNEELNTVNAEYQEKVMRLNQLNADLDTMAKAVGVATIFVDEHLLVSRFSPDAVGLFNLRESDIGRPLSDLQHNFMDHSLLTHFTNTLQSGRVFEKELVHQNKQTYLLRILPYQVPSTNKKGAVASFINVTTVQDNKLLQYIMDALPEQIAVLSLDGKITLVNQAWMQFAKFNGDAQLDYSGVGHDYLQACQQRLGTDKASADKICLGVTSVLEGTKPNFSMHYACPGPEPEQTRWFVVHVTKIVADNDVAVVVSHVNLSHDVPQSKTAALQ